MASKEPRNNGATHGSSFLGKELDALEEVSVTEELSKPKDGGDSKRSVASLPSTATEGDLIPHESWDMTLVPAAATKRRTWVERHFVVSENNLCRKIWNCYVLVLLLYTGTVLPFKIAFIESAVPDSKSFSPQVERIEFLFLDVGFYIDLVVHFFFTYKDARGREVFCMKQIALKYLRTHFVLNLIACIPSGFVSWIACTLVGSDGCIDDTSANEVTRVGRLQRITRLARLVRLLRIAKFASYVTSSRLWAIMRSQRGMRIINSFGSLLFVIHLCASGWYLCASMHQNHEETWLNRRSITSSGETILDLHDKYGPFQQWLTSMYFILTVFTTVGFGDMSAVTIGEMIYVSGAMIIGCIVNGIILSEVITAITRTTAQETAVEERKKLLEDFAAHTQLDARTTGRLVNALTTSRAKYVAYSRDSMKQLFTGSDIPRTLLTSLPENLFGGEMLKHQFISVASRLVGQLGLPPRFPLLVAIALETITYDAGQIVYHAQDHAWNVYLVTEGTFAFIGKPDPSGGIANVPALTIEPVQALAKAFSPASPSSSSKIDGLLTSPSSQRVVNVTSSLTPTAILNLPSTLAGGTESSILKGKLKRLLTQDVKNVEIMPQDLSPYTLFGKYSYFGEVELVLNSWPRPSTARCESKEGVVMVLHKRSLHELIEEFPRVAHSWRSTARRREVKRRRQLKELRFAHESHEHFAVSILQKHWRMYKLTGKMTEHVGGMISNGARASHTTPKASLASGPLCSMCNALITSPGAISHPGARSLEATPAYVRDLRTDVMGLQDSLATLRANMQAEVSKINNTLQGLSKSLEAQRQPRPTPDRPDSVKQTFRAL